MRDEKPLISERNARDLSPEMRAKYHVIGQRPLTREEVARAYAFARQEAQPGSLLVYLLADLDRLRALVKAGERGTNVYPVCPWCEWDGGGHRADCAAFTPEGLVK